MSFRPFRYLTLLLLLVLPLISVAGTSAAPMTLDHFLRTWARTDKPVADLAVNRTWMWGPDGYTGVMAEPYAEAPGGQRIVQYFDKSRMEDNSYRASDPWDVTNGLLVVELMTGYEQDGDNLFPSGQGPAEINVGGDADDPTGPTYATMQVVSGAPPLADGALVNQRLARNGTVTSDATLGSYGVTAAYRVIVPNLDHQVASVFWDFMNSTGTVWEADALTSDKLFLNPFYATGYPVTEAYWSNIKVGGVYQDVLVQCFQRRCLTFTPDNPNGWRVEAGNVGQHYYTWRYLEPLSRTVWSVSGQQQHSTMSTTWQPVPEMQLHVETPVGGDMAVTFCAETGGNGGGMRVRAVVDGQVIDPSNVLFAVPAGGVGVRSFTFSTHGLTKGSHDVQIEWLVDPGSTGTVFFDTLTVLATPDDIDHGGLAVRTAQSGPPVTTTQTSWSVIPDMSTAITTTSHGVLAISLSAEAWTDGYGMYTRVFVDNQLASPIASDTIFVGGGLVGTTAFTWTMRDVPAGTHAVRVEWAVDSGKTGSMGDRTLAVSASPPIPERGGVAVVSTALDSLTLNAQTWTPIADMHSSISTSNHGVLAITFSAEAQTSKVGGYLAIHVLLDGQPVDPFGVYFAVGDRLEARSFTFSATDVPAGSHVITVEWLTADSSTTGYLWNRSLAVVGRWVP